MTSDAWDPAQYERFRKERSQPFFDLLALVQKSPAMRVIDLGCGTGEWTRHLHVELGATTTLGVDRSEAMLSRASALAFEAHEIAAWASARGHDKAYDLIFSNAALHWLPDHDALLTHLTRALAPIGQLAVQVPANFDHATHRVAAEVALEPAIAARFAADAPPREVLAPEAYARSLHRLGYVEQHVRLQVYPHVLPSREDVIEWVKGTLLTEYEARLSPDGFARFMTRYRERLFEELPDERPFFYPFKRILFWARRGPG